MVDVVFGSNPPGILNPFLSHGLTGSPTSIIHFLALLMRSSFEESSSTMPIDLATAGLMCFP